MYEDSETALETYEYVLEIDPNQDEALTKKAVIQIKYYINF